MVLVLVISFAQILPIYTSNPMVIYKTLDLVDLLIGWNETLQEDCLEGRLCNKNAYKENIPLKKVTLVAVSSQLVC